MMHLAEILSSPMLMSEKGIRAYAPLVLAALNGKDISVSDAVFNANKILNTSFELKGSNQDNDNANNPKKIAVVPIIGAITKYDQACGPSGLKTKMQFLQNAAQDPSIGAIILKIDSPGGEGSFLDVFASEIRSIQKPVLAYIEGIAASAGYWIASQADEIYASSTMDFVGSIGAYVTYADYKNYFERKGILIKEVYADLSPEKNKFFHDLFKEEPDDAIVKNNLNQLVEKFHADINLKRNISDSHALAGAIFQGQDALDTNLVDDFLSFNAVVNRAFTLIHQNQNSNAMATKEKNYAHIALTLGLETQTIVLTDNHASLSEDHLNTIDEQLHALASANDAVNSLQSDLSGKVASLKEKDTEIESLQADVARLKNKAAGKGTTTKKDKDDFHDGYPDDQFKHFAHNQIIDEMI